MSTPSDTGIADNFRFELVKMVFLTRPGGYLRNPGAMGHFSEDLRAVGAAAEFAENALGLELRVGASAG